MSNQASEETYRSLSEKRINRIVNALKDIECTEKELDMNILPYYKSFIKKFDYREHTLLIHIQGMLVCHGLRQD